MSGCVHYRFTTQITVIHCAQNVSELWMFFFLSLYLLAAFVSTQSMAIEFTLATLIHGIPCTTRIETIRTDYTIQYLWLRRGIIKYYRSNWIESILRVIIINIRAIQSFNCYTRCKRRYRLVSRFYLFNFARRGAISQLIFIIKTSSSSDVAYWFTKILR